MVSPSQAAQASHRAGKTIEFLINILCNLFGGISSSTQNQQRILVGQWCEVLWFGFRDLGQRIVELFVSDFSETANTKKSPISIFLCGFHRFRGQQRRRQQKVAPATDVAKVAWKTSTQPVAASSQLNDTCTPTRTKHSLWCGGSASARIPTAQQEPGHHSRFVFFNISFFQNQLKAVLVFNLITYSF